MEYDAIVLGRCRGRQYGGRKGRFIYDSLNLEFARVIDCYFFRFNRGSRKTNFLPAMESWKLKGNGANKFAKFNLIRLNDFNNL